MGETLTNLGSFPENVTRFLLNLVTRKVLAGVVLYSLWLAVIHYHYWFSWHIILCTLGYIPLMTEAIMLFNRDELWTRQIARGTKNWIHAALITTGTVILTIGVLVLSYYTQGEHFTTAHGITGLISMLLGLVSLIIGLGANYSQKLSRYCRPIWIKAVHNLIGILCYVIGIASLCFAYYTNWFVFYTTQESRTVALVCTIIFSLWPLNGAFVSGYNQLKSLIT